MDDVSKAAHRTDTAGVEVLEEREHLVAVGVTVAEPGSSCRASRPWRAGNIVSAGRWHGSNADPKQAKQIQPTSADSDHGSVPAHCLANHVTTQESTMQPSDYRHIHPHSPNSVAAMLRFHHKGHRQDLCPASQLSSVPDACPGKLDPIPSREYRNSNRHRSFRKPRSKRRARPGLRGGRTSQCGG